MNPDAERMTRKLLSTTGLLRHDPVLTILVVNKLIPHGKDSVLSLLSYLAKSDRIYDSTSMMLLLRALFEVPRNPGYFPVMLVGGLLPWNFADRRSAPRYPMMLYADIPLVPIISVQGGGAPQSASDHIDYCRSNCDLRRSALRPPHGALPRSQWPSRPRTRRTPAPS